MGSGSTYERQRLLDFARRDETASQDDHLVASSQSYDEPCLLVAIEPRKTETHTQTRWGLTAEQPLQVVQGVRWLTGNNAERQTLQVADGYGSRNGGEGVRVGVGRESGKVEGKWKS